jgi:hypothetical protein
MCVLAMLLNLLQRTETFTSWLSTAFSSLRNLTSEIRESIAKQKLLESHWGNLCHKHQVIEHCHDKCGKIYFPKWWVVLWFLTMEIFLRNTNDNPDWIRFYNTTANCVFRDTVQRVYDGLQDIISFHRTWVSAFLYVHKESMAFPGPCSRK